MRLAGPGVDHPSRRRPLAESMHQPRPSRLPAAALRRRSSIQTGRHGRGAVAATQEGGDARGGWSRRRGTKSRRLPRAPVPVRGNRRSHRALQPLPLCSCRRHGLVQLASSRQPCPLAVCHEWARPCRLRCGLGGRGSGEAPSGRWHHGCCCQPARCRLDTRLGLAPRDAFTQEGHALDLTQRTDCRHRSRRLACCF
jgi:hypothetical protein